MVVSDLRETPVTRRGSARRRGSEMPSPSEGRAQDLWVCRVRKGKTAGSEKRIHSDPDGDRLSRDGDPLGCGYTDRDGGRWSGAVGADGPTWGWTSASNGSHTADGCKCGLFVFLAFLASRSRPNCVVNDSVAISKWETAREMLGRAHVRLPSVWWQRGSNPARAAANE